MVFPRSSGILLHVTSLPGDGGVGDLGRGAYAFLDFLESARQSLWQLLPLGPPAKGNSPYSCYSAFAGNSLLIDVEGLVDLQLVSAEQLAQARHDAADTAEAHAANAVADFERARRYKMPLIAEAFRCLQASADHPLREPLDRFRSENQSWLADFALFSALATEFGDTDWTRWERNLVCREPSALQRWRDELADEIALIEFTQFLFRMQYDRLKSEANQRGIQLFGDMPIFVARESADVWANQQIFALDESGNPSVVAGVPPDYFSETGQLWGNPLYDWEELRKTDFRWWIDRFRAAFRDFDILRLDHFRGFEAYWEVPADAETAVDGRWVDGPRDGLFAAVGAALGELPIIAEDLGMITDEVHALRDRLGFPGMRVMQFGFDQEHDVFHRPDHFPQHSVAYTGTHDNDTIIGWYNARGGDSDPILSRFLQAPEECGLPIHWQLIQLVLNSAADTAIIPMQDLLGLDTNARMNIPGQATGNWTWRCAANAFAPETAQHLAQLTIDSGRNPAPPAQ